MKQQKTLGKKEILEKLKEHRDELDKFSVKKIGLFGSFLKGKQGKDSDIDFLVSLKNPTFDNYMDLKFFLEKLFNKKVDLIMEDALKPSIKYIKEEAVYA